MFRCPECKQTEDGFTIHAQQWVNVRVDKEEMEHAQGGINEPGNIEWNDDSTIQCGECGHDGNVSDFRKSFDKEGTCNS